MALIWLVESLMALLFAAFVFLSIVIFVMILLSPFLSLEDYDSNVYLHDDTSDFSEISTNIKAKGTTKMRWAKRSQQPDDSFANGIMWADLGND